MDRPAEAPARRGWTWSGIDHFRGLRGLLGGPGQARRRPRRAAGSRARARPSSRPSAKRLGGLPLIAEDLGVITPDVEALRDRVRPARDARPPVRLRHRPRGREAPAAPLRPPLRRLHGHARQRHARWAGSRPATSRRRSRSREVEAERAFALRYLGTDGRGVPLGHDPPGASASVADIAIVPMQDILGLDSRARMNMPGEGRGELGLAVPRRSSSRPEVEGDGWPT